MDETSRSQTVPPETWCAAAITILQLRSADHTAEQIQALELAAMTLAMQVYEGHTLARRVPLGRADFGRAYPDWEALRGILDGTTSLNASLLILNSGSEPREPAVRQAPAGGHERGGVIVQVAGRGRPIAHLVRRFVRQYLSDGYE